MAKEKSKKKKNKKGLVAAISLIAVLVIAGLIWAWVALTPGYIFVSDAVSNYYKAISDEDRELYKKTCYTSKWKDNYSNGGTDLDAALDEAYALQSVATYSNVKLVSEEALDDEYAEKMEDSLKNHYGIDVSISKIESVSFKVDVDFDGAVESSGTITRYCYKSGFKWFFLSDPAVQVDLGIEG